MFSFSKSKSPLTPFICAVLVLLVVSCGSEESETDNNEPNLNSSDIQISILENAVLSGSNITVNLPDDNTINLLNVYLDEDLINTFSSPPYQFSIDPKAYLEGNHQLKIEVLFQNKVIGTRVLNVKVDNSGPTLSLEGIQENQKICGTQLIVPDITDEFSSVSKVEVFLDNEPVATFENTSSHSFNLNTENYALGSNVLKFVMEDDLGNTTADSLNILIARKVLDLNIPGGFIRTGTEKLHAILSDADGNNIDYATHSSGKAETLTLCTSTEMTNDTEYILSFVDDFDSQIFNFYVYGNLSKMIVGDEISFSPRSSPTSASFVDLTLPDYEDGFYIRATTPWSSMIYYNDSFSGHYSTNFTISELGFDKVFIMYYNRDLGRSYQWAFIEDLSTKTSLSAEDFNSSDVIHDFLTVNGTSQSPFLSIYGFESENHFNTMSGHMLYWNSSLNSVNNNDYSYANIFDHTIFSLKVSNYGIDGAGAPPKSVTVPGQTISYQFQNNGISFNGIPNYEVGRVRLSNFNDAHINMEFIFDGQATDIAVPKLPEGIFPSKVTDVFENGSLETVQGLAENYENMNNYEEYISKIFVPSIPFYIVSPKRERIFYSNVGPNLLPIHEFPFFERL
ncbi:Ig-like domain-containing protein [Flagellimonas sp. CMM7]|uniref:Ig-like domain-containing protein n=1 Tax=Flagellimonas sp. CMM7 TaxID=2654676 RepID=UPI0013D62D7C|nr:Ig-like domain-containing protein [Flagellimonas sp. CMM7]UII79058.1 hypothetical protein LV704_15530 [Flagellimonas sp. CMM7]